MLSRSMTWGRWRVTPSATGYGAKHVWRPRGRFARNADALETWLEQDGSPRAMAVRNGILDAWRAMKAEGLERQRAAVVAAMHAGRDADRLALELARRLRDPELYSLTIGHAEPAVALAAVQAAERELDALTALGVLARRSIASPSPPPRCSRSAGWPQLTAPHSSCCSIACPIP